MPAIDRTHLDRQTSGDARLAAEVLRLFRDQVAPLAADPDEGAWQKLPLARMLHTVRGAALGIGATALSRAALKLEALESPLAWSLFRAALADTLAEIERILAEAADAPPG